MLRQQTSDAKRRVSVGEGLIEIANAMKHFRNAMAGVITQFSSALRPTTHNLMMLKVLATAITAIARDEPL